MKRCLFCDSSFIMVVTWQKYCSYQCARKHAWQRTRQATANYRHHQAFEKNPTIRFCRRCNRQFSPNPNYHYFCSKQCKAEHDLLRTKPVTKCKNCGCLFMRLLYFNMHTGYKQTVYCSSECGMEKGLDLRIVRSQKRKDAHLASKQEDLSFNGICRHCRHPFLKVRRYDNYCSHTCKWMDKAKHYGEATCPTCDVTFTKLTTTSKFCSRRCRKDYNAAIDLLRRGTSIRREELPTALITTKVQIHRLQRILYGRELK